MATFPGQEPGFKPNLDPYKHVPTGILAQAETNMFPHATHADLQELSGHGWSRYGVATAIVSESGEILMLDHAESPKLTEGQLGPLMETSRLRPGQVETTEQTIYRSFQEELTIDKPEKLKLRARILGGWTLNKWPAGNINGHSNELVFGVNPIVVIPDEIVLKFKRSPFIKSDEIRTARFMRPKEIEASPQLRPGVLEWLGGLTARRLLDHRQGTYHPVNFSDIDVLHEPGWTDAVFANVGL